MKTLTVKLPETLASWLSYRAKQLGRPQSELVREALEQARRGTGSVSCHDLMADVCGSVPGPKDLSTNPKHMDGFGK
ncbi:MAG: CopG family transcriptional regulator [Betaproteobacteria bacterium]|nr:CopG family transcriptional regulator [Betaproteobacteria bacterium]